MEEIIPRILPADLARSLAQLDPWSAWSGAIRGQLQDLLAPKPPDPSWSGQGHRRLAVPDHRDLSDTDPGTLIARRANRVLLRPLSRPPDGVLRLRIAMAGGPGEHRRLDTELEEVLFLTWRWHREIGTLVAELPCQPIAGLGMRDVAGHPAQVEGVLVVFEGERMHSVASVAVKVFLLWRRHNERVQPGLAEQRTHRVQPWSAVVAHCGEEGQADAEVVQQVGSLGGKFWLPGFEFAP